jgi:hypothetical protein
MRTPDGRTRWKTLNYIRGGTVEWTTGRSIEVRFVNYLQFRGVRPGLNTFTIKLERSRGVDVESFEVLPDSGLILTGTGPAQLEVSLDKDRYSVNLGDEFDVGYTIWNRGDRPALAVEIAPEHPKTLSLVGRSSRRRNVLRESMSGAFRFRAVTPGFYRAALFVTSGSNQPAVEFEVRVKPAISGWENVGSVATRAAGAVLLTVGVVAIWPLRRRRNRSE